MQLICDTHILLFWADAPGRLSNAAMQAIESGKDHGILACSGISLWEIALLFRKNRLELPANHDPLSYIEDIVKALNLTVLPITPAIATLSESGIISHGDPADRIIAATAINHKAKLITADEKLRSTIELECIW
jgi:PIN domain nuclease of toxin-antitoxin system